MVKREKNSATMAAHQCFVLLYAVGWCGLKRKRPANPQYLRRVWVNMVQRWHGWRIANQAQGSAVLWRLSSTSSKENPVKGLGKRAKEPANAKRGARETWAAGGDLSNKSQDTDSHPSPGSLTLEKIRVDFYLETELGRVRIDHDFSSYCD